MELLISDSPFREEIQADTLPNTDNDNPKESTSQHNPFLPVPPAELPWMAAVIDSENLDDTMDSEKDKPVTKSPSLDPVYFRCRAAKTIGFRETLVSISSDDTFGERVVTQTSTIGTVKEHPS